MGQTRRKFRESPSRRVSYRHQDKSHLLCLEFVVNYALAGGLVLILQSRALEVVEALVNPPKRTSLWVCDLRKALAKTSSRQRTQSYRGLVQQGELNGWLS